MPGAKVLATQRRNFRAGWLVCETIVLTVLLRSPVFRLAALAGPLLVLAAPAAQAQRVAVLRLPDLQRRLARPTDTTYVVNFWATWCGPCVAELPDFERVRAATAGGKVRFLLVSLDYLSQLDKKVRPFVAQQKLGAEVALLNEPDPNTWLASVDAQWSGAIPFTLIFNNHTKQRATFEQPLTAAELTAALGKFPQ